jgi:predicted alpha/beta-hydrolase family hydrolase
MLWDGPTGASVLVILAHGAGAPMDTPFMDTFAKGLGESGMQVGRFEFSYMARRREDQKRRPPSTQSILLREWKEALASLPPHEFLFIGGKSMGGRMATLLVTEVDDAPKVDGLVCLGYPFHPTGKPEKLRTAHLAMISTPTLIVQGERDPMGTREEVDGYELSDVVDVHWLRDGDHSFKPRKASGTTLEANLEDGVEAVVSFVNRLSCA